MKEQSPVPVRAKRLAVWIAFLCGALAATHLSVGRAMAQLLCPPESVQCTVVKGHVLIRVTPSRLCSCDSFRVARDHRVEIPVLTPPLLFQDPELCDGTHVYSAVCWSKLGASDPVSCTVSCPCKIEGLTCTPEASNRIRVRWDPTPSGCCDKILVRLRCDDTDTSSLALPGTQTEVIIDGCALPCGLSRVCVTCMGDDDSESEETCCYRACVPGTPVFVRGDVNGDGIVDMSDAIRILGYLFLGNPQTLSCTLTADTDDNEDTELSDAVYLLGYLFLGRAAPIQPFPECGLDPTPDALGCASYDCQ